MFYLLLEKANVPEEVTAILERTGLKGSVVILHCCNCIDDSTEEVDGRRVDGDEVLSLFLVLVCLLINRVVLINRREQGHLIPQFHVH